MKIALSIDWLQLHVSCENIKFNSYYTWLPQTYQTKQFRKVFKVVFRGEEFATCVCDPNSSIIPKNCMLVKFSNRELYGQNIVSMVDDFLDQSNLEYLGMTRIDIAADFNTFNDGLDPHIFLKRFVRAKYLKVGQGKYQINGSQSLEHTFDYLRFGSKTSDINIYLYNKTKEFAEVKDKPYIRERWKQYDLNLNKTIWRLEISLKSKGSDYRNQRDGKQCKLNYKDLTKGNFLNQYYMSFIQKYFRFVINDNKCRKDRMQQLDLFRYEYTPFVPSYLPKESGAEKSDKVFLKKLHNLDQELRGFSQDLYIPQREILTNFAAATGLTEYYQKKRSEWTRDCYRSS